MEQEHEQFKKKKDSFTSRYQKWVEEGKKLMIEGDLLALDCDFRISPGPMEANGKRTWSSNWSVKTKQVTLASG